MYALAAIVMRDAWLISVNDQFFRGINTKRGKQEQLLIAPLGNKVPAQTALAVWSRIHSALY